MRHSTRTGVAVALLLSLASTFTLVWTLLSRVGIAANQPILFGGGGSSGVCDKFTGVAIHEEAEEGKRFTMQDNQRHLQDETLQSPPRLFFVVTSTIHYTKSDGNKERQDGIRREQYIRGIRSLLNATQDGFPLPHSIILVENSHDERSQGPTYLDELAANASTTTAANNISVVYTHNNQRNISNKGEKELVDILVCIDRFGMKNHDLIVKMTGRYYLQPQSQFIDLLRLLLLGNHDTKQDDTSNDRTIQAIVKFGSYLNPVDSSAAAGVEDCITGLILLPVASVRCIANDPRHQRSHPIEWAWARAALQLPPHRRHAVRGKMGIMIAPEWRDYFEV